MIDFEAEIRKSQALDKQIREERRAETEKVNKMSDEERIEYFLEIERRASEFANIINMKQKEVVLDENKEEQ